MVGVLEVCSAVDAPSVAEAVTDSAVDCTTSEVDWIVGCTASDVD
jgi:hypothetical protein